MVNSRPGEEVRGTLHDIRDRLAPMLLAAGRIKTIVDKNSDRFDASTCEFTVPRSELGKIYETADLLEQMILGCEKMIAALPEVHGLGLTVVRRALSSFGGELLEPTPGPDGHGACLEVLMPFVPIDLASKGMGFELGQAIREIAQQMSLHLEDCGVHLELGRLCGSPIYIAGDVLRFHRAVQNLVLNGRDAILEANRPAGVGKIDIITGIEGRVAFMRVIDNGCGFAAKKLKS